MCLFLAPHLISLDSKGDLSHAGRGGPPLTAPHCFSEHISISPLSRSGQINTACGLKPDVLNPAIHTRDQTLKSCEVNQRLHNFSHCFFITAQRKIFRMGLKVIHHTASFI